MILFCFFVVAFQVYIEHFESSRREVDINTLKDMIVLADIIRSDNDKFYLEIIFDNIQLSSDMDVYGKYPLLSFSRNNLQESSLLPIRDDDRMISWIYTNSPSGDVSVNSEAEGYWSIDRSSGITSVKFSISIEVLQDILGDDLSNSSFTLFGLVFKETELIVQRLTGKMWYGTASTKMQFFIQYVRELTSSKSIFNMLSNSDLFYDSSDDPLIQYTVITNISELENAEIVLNGDLFTVSSFYTYNDGKSHEINIAPTALGLLEFEETGILDYDIQLSVNLKLPNGETVSHVYDRRIYFKFESLDIVHKVLPVSIEHCFDGNHDCFKKNNFIFPIEEELYFRLLVEVDSEKYQLSDSNFELSFVVDDYSFVEPLKGKVIDDIDPLDVVTDFNPRYIDVDGIKYLVGYITLKNARNYLNPNYLNFHTKVKFDTQELDGDVAVEYLSGIVLNKPNEYFVDDENEDSSSLYLYFNCVLLLLSLFIVWN